MRVLVFVLLCLIWGSTWLAIKIGLTDAPPLTTAALRFLLATAILTAIVWARGYRYPREKKTILMLGYPGIYMYCAGYALVYFAQQRIDSALAAVLFAAFPFFVALLSWFRFKTERPDSGTWLGMALGFLGVLCISYDSLQTSGDLFFGAALALAGAFAAAYGVVIHKQHHLASNIVVAANIQMIFGGVLLVLAALIFEDFADFHPSLAAIGSIIYLALLGTVVTFLGYYWLLKRMRIVTVSLIAFITPLVAILLGVSLAGEALSPLIAAGTVLILSGVLFAIRRRTLTANRG